MEEQTFQLVMALTSIVMLALVTMVGIAFRLTYLELSSLRDKLDSVLFELRKSYVTREELREVEQRIVKRVDRIKGD